MRHPVDPSTYDAADPFGSMSGGRTYPHTGSDYRVSFAEVYAPCDSVVYHTGNNSGNGNYITLYLPGHDWDGVEGGAYLSFLHLSSINVADGNTVKEGQKIGVSGNSGTNSRGAHLHLTLSNSDRSYLGEGAKVSPFDWIQARLGAPVAPKPPAPVKPPVKPVAPPSKKAQLTAQKRQIEDAIRKLKTADRANGKTAKDLEKKLAAVIAQLAALPRQGK
jgi:murein DD-endopeptidase MepM/ murein hydrolase activator NlpD